ncbi:MAG: hypothetical protein JNM56_03630 [Planctomycetia bacterium]|nr:hypothetical protein [Planctomycetia bacterium]
MILVPEMILPAALAVSGLLMGLFIWAQRRRARWHEEAQRGERLPLRRFQ